MVVNEQVHYYLFLILLISLQRFYELWLSHKHEVALLKKGGFEVGQKHFPFMVLVQALWLLLSLLESLTIKETPPLYFIATFFVLFLIGQYFRLLAIFTLKERWTVKVIILPEAPVKTGGIYSKIRHPNYLGMIIEVFSLPLILGLWKTALIASLLNAIILTIRIKCEEKALSEFADYANKFQDKGRILPS